MNNCAKWVEVESDKFKGQSRVLKNGFCCCLLLMGCGNKMWAKRRRVISDGIRKIV